MYSDPDADADPDPAIFVIDLQDANKKISVADPGCLSRIPDPDFYRSRIPDLKTAIKDMVKKNLLSYLFFGVINFTKLNYFIFEMLKKKKIGPIFKELQNFLPKKWSLSSQKYGFEIRDPGKALFRIPGSKRHRIPDPDPQH
jgi:hypothetical protein